MADKENEDVRKLFKCFKTVNEMLKDRGYIISAEDLNSDYETFENKFEQEYKNNRENICIISPHSDNASDTIMVFFPNDDKLSIPTIKQYIVTMKTQNVSRAVVIVKQDITTFARKTLERINSTLKIEIFKQSELMINITHHILVPKHIVLNEKEKKALLNKYSLKESQLPRIQKLDPLSRYFGCERGQVFKIIRKSETAGRYVTYRIVV